MRVDTGSAETGILSEVIWTMHPTGIAESTPVALGTTTLLAGFDDQQAAAAAAEAIATDPRLAGAVGSVTVEPVDADAWADPDRRATVTIAGGPITFGVGPAFGDGGHPTTRLALGLLARIVTSGDRVLDFGTGTGVLALAALRLGAAAVTAVENDPGSLVVARDNLASATDRGRARVVESLDEGDEPVEVAVANVLLVVHRRWGPRIARSVTAAGRVIVTGILESQRPEVEAIYEPLVAIDRAGDDDWAALTLARPGTAR